MARFDRDLSAKGPFEFNPGAFFFKLVKRYASVDAAGSILSLGHLKELILEGKASGPRGGLRVRYNSLQGRATTLRFAQEGARILAVDRIIASAEEIPRDVSCQWSSLG